MLGTGKSLELMGLAAFNAFLAMVLTVTFLGSSSKAHLNKLTEANIRSFIAEATKVSTGQGVDQFGITEYLMKHIDDASTFTTKLAYDIPNTDSEEQTVELGKKDYISHVLEDIKHVKGAEATTNIEDIHIEDGATQARVVTTSYERGEMAVTGPDQNPTTLPIRGISYCEQTIILKDQTIRMAGATCSTNIQAAPSE
jgi:hypothetical protein